MTVLLADRLKAARRYQFVGRAAEQDLFHTVLAAAELPFCVLYVFGPGGVGKTTLLRAFTALCERAQTPIAYLDGREIDPSPDSFVQALRTAMQLTPGGDPIEVLSNLSQRYVILVDTYETLAPLDDWVRDQFMPQLSEHILVVLSGRQPPALAWRADLGWQSMIHSLPLRNLSPAESRLYLTRRGLPAEQHETILQFTHGHPLALSLVADGFAQRHDMQFQPEAVPDIIKMLLEQFIQKVPGPAHRAALEACALVRLTTETLLAELLGMADVREIFDWLRELSFIEAGTRGLFPHDLAREALVADLRWRNPDWSAELHRRARAYYARSLQQSHGHAQQRVMFDYVFLHRENPMVRPFLEWQESGSGLSDRMADHDIPLLVNMVARHEGTQSARLAEHWFARQQHNVIVYRDSRQQPTGFLLTLNLQSASATDLAADEAAAAALRYIQRNSPLRPGETAAMFRFWMARDTYQDVSAVQSLIFVNIAQYYMNTPGLAYTFFPSAAPEFWEPAFTYMDLNRVDELAFEANGRHFGIFTHDWRLVPPLAWLDLLAERELATAPLMHTAAAAPQLVVLSQPAFEAGVRDALQNLARPNTLRRNPLLQSRLVLEHSGTPADEAERVTALQRLIREAAEVLQGSPREMKYYRALYHTYLNAAPTQEQAAEILDLPFSTFRRHLKTGVARVAEMLWQRELQGPAI